MQVQNSSIMVAVAFQKRESRRATEATNPPFPETANAYNQTHQFCASHAPPLNVVTALQLYVRLDGRFKQPWVPSICRA